MLQPIIMIAERLVLARLRPATMCAIRSLSGD